MKFLILVASLLISGCSIFAPLKPKFPAATPELMKNCENLTQLQGDKVTITEMLKTVINNYTLYYECSTKVEGWQEWYNTQKQIYESAK